jgi:hypothetical protein
LTHKLTALHANIWDREDFPATRTGARFRVSGVLKKAEVFEFYGAPRPDDGAGRC